VTKKVPQACKEKASVLRKSVDSPKRMSIVLFKRILQERVMADDIISEGIKWTGRSACG
jgi:hypothetical protein